MLSIEASKLLIVEGVEDDPAMRARADRLRGGIVTEDVRHVGDEALNRILAEERPPKPLNGMRADFEPIVIFNRFRFDDTEEEQQRRIAAYPALDRLKYNGYGGFDWRESGSPAYRERTGLVCQPAYAIHSVTGCHFRCAYCSLSRVINVMLNMEEFVGRLDDWIEQCPRQTLFQYDNYTDIVCFEPEYGGTKLLIDYFAGQPGRALELYVGKSDNVDFLLDYDHRGHTVCCWSLAAQTQSTEFEYRSAPMDARIEAMRKCQQAGYAVRVRLSPVIPVRNWRAENRAMIETLFERVVPDVVSIETIRFLDYEAMQRLFDLSLLDDAFVGAMKSAAGKEVPQGCEVPDAFRREVYRFILDELDRCAPNTPFAFCREALTMWEHFADRLARHGQRPGRYLCNCGPYSAPAGAGRLATASAQE